MPSHELVKRESTITAPVVREHIKIGDRIQSANTTFQTNWPHTRSVRRLNTVSSLLGSGAAYGFTQIPDRDHSNHLDYILMTILVGFIVMGVVHEAGRLTNLELFQAKIDKGKMDAEPGDVYPVYIVEPKSLRSAWKSGEPTPLKTIYAQKPLEQPVE